MLNLYTTDYSLYFVNCRRTKNAVRHTHMLGFGKKYHSFWSELVSYIILAGPVGQIGMLICVVLSVVVITKLCKLHHSFC